MRLIPLIFLPFLLFANPNATLIVTGEAAVIKPAEIVTLTIATVTENERAKEALKENNRLMHQLQAVLKEFGIRADEMSYGQFSLSPTYTSQPRNRITGYRVNNSLILTTEKIDQIGEIITKVTDSGAGTIGQLNFDVKERRAYRNEAINEATKNGIEDAKAVASAANLELLRIKKITLDQGGDHPMQRSFALSSPSTPITEGSVMINASVTLEIEAAEN